MNAIVQAVRAKHLASKKMRGPDMRTGAKPESQFQKDMRTGNGCGPNPGNCPPGSQVSIAQLAAARGQSVVPGELGSCKWNMLPLSGTILAANAGSITMTDANTPVGLCVEKIVAIVEGTPVFFSNLTFGNTNQWMQNELYDQDLFRPDGRCSACCLPMDCFKNGTNVSVMATRIPDAAADADIDIFFYLIGPAIGV